MKSKIVPTNFTAEIASMPIPLSFSVSLYGNMVAYSDTLSKCRVRIFYKGMNRNRTYITEEFAAQLIASLPYTPIKGIFNKQDEDFEDHGRTNSDGKIYGVVPENPNFAWEDHMDIDGVVRTYACADVLLFTALYSEANLIPDKSQSMEIYEKTLVGKWKVDENGEPYYFFEKGCFLGLQTLGDLTEPCFEGAAFYTLQKELKEVINYIKKISKQEEEKKMDKTLFRLSDNEKCCALEGLLNPNFTEEGGWVQDRIVLDVYDDYAVCYNMQNGNYERAYYAKDGDNITVGDIVTVYVVDVTKEELSALEAIKTASGSYEVAKASLEEVDSLKNTIQQKEEAIVAKDAEIEELNTTFAQKVTDLENLTNENNELKEQVSNFTTKTEAFESEKAELEQTISDIRSENETLISFKRQIETEKKEEILAKYEEHLSEEVYGQLKTDIEKYSVSDFKKEVCTAAVESSSTIFDRENDNKIYYTAANKNSSKDSSYLEQIINKYKNGGND